MRKFILVILSLCIFLNTEAQIDPNLENMLQDVLDSSVNNGGNRGVSAFLIMPDGKTWKGTAGVGRDDIPISDITLFHGASTTKLNVAILMLMLAEEGLVDLDESWSEYISLDVDFNPTITIRQLLNHTSGISDYLETPSSGNNVISDFSYFYTPQNILENIVSGNPIFAPGTNFQYSNSNYALAALIIEQITGNSVHVELRNRIWQPLEMNHTYFGAYDSYSEPTAGVWWNFGNGITNYSEEPTTSMLSYAYGAGNIVTCPTDLGRLLDALLNEQLISTESLNQMLTLVPESFNSWTAGYGLGIHRANVSSEDLVIGHDGYYTNLTDMFHSKSHGFTLVTMTNTQTTWFGLFNPMYDILVDYILTTGTNELHVLDEIKVYPNPTNNTFYIESMNLIEEVKITDATGKVCFISSPNKLKINLSLDKEGLYLVTIKSGKQISTQKILVKQ